MGSSASNPTEIEVRFSGEGGRTRVELEHRGWERLGDRAAAARASYSEGWALVFGEYERVVRAGCLIDNSRGAADDPDAAADQPARTPPVL